MCAVSKGMGMSADAGMELWILAILMAAAGSISACLSTGMALLVHVASSTMSHDVACEVLGMAIKGLATCMECMACCKQTHAENHGRSKPGAPGSSTDHKPVPEAEPQGSKMPTSGGKQSRILLQPAGHQPTAAAAAAGAPKAFQAWAVCLPASGPPCSQRSGTKASGSGHRSLLRCMAHRLTSRDSPFLIL